MTHQPSAADHLKLVYKVAWSMVRRPDIRRVFEFDELVSIGFFGLLSACRTYRPGGGRTFANHAIRRIRGEIKDALRLWEHSRRKRTVRVELAAVAFLDEHPAKTKPPDQQAADADAVAYVLSQLSGNVRQAIFLRATSGETDRDICRSLHKSNSYLAVAMKAIRKRLQGCGAFE